MSNRPSHTCTRCGSKFTLLLYVSGRLAAQLPTPPGHMCAQCIVEEVENLDDGKIYELTEYAGC